VSWPDAPASIPATSSDATRPTTIYVAFTLCVHNGVSAKWTPIQGCYTIEGETPILTLKSFILQEAEAVGREAKLRAAAVMGLRVVSLQHDGVAFTGFGVAGRQAEIAEAMSREVTAACGYRAVVALEAAQV